MNMREQSVIHQAVAFFDGSDLVKEMLSVEFDAVLDQVVGLPDFADREVRACFLRINQRLQVLGAVFFLVDFDSRGYVNRSWNIPLQHLLDSAARGPDLGAGRIRLACRSQCPMSWHQRQLWDPQWEGDASSFRQLQAAVRRNRLGLPADLEEEEEDAGAEPPLLQVNAPRSDQLELRLREHRDRLAALAGEHQLQMAALQSQMQEQINQLHQRYQMQLNQANEALASAKQLFVDEKRRHQSLKESLDGRASELRDAREQLQRELAEERGAELDHLQRQFELELKTRLEQASAELKEMLDMREVELFYREEQLGNLREEISRLRQERERLISHSGDRLLQRLVESGVTFVAYQPGAEALTLSASDIPRYLESPQGYAAEFCFVAPAQYQRWLDHHQLPVCAEPLPDGSICGEPVPKVERPADFIGGASDRCGEHGRHGAGIADVVAAQAAPVDSAAQGGG